VKPIFLTGKSLSPLSHTYYGHYFAVESQLGKQVVKPSTNGTTGTPTMRTGHRPKQLVYHRRLYWAWLNFRLQQNYASIAPLV